MLNLKSLSEVHLYPGQKASYPFRKHVSVGFDAEYEIQDEAILVMIQEQTQYHTPEKLIEPGWTGGDNASSQFVFEAKKPGVTELVVRHLFRGHIEESVCIRIIVDEKNP